MPKATEITPNLPRAFAETNFRGVPRTGRLGGSIRSEGSRSSLSQWFTSELARAFQTPGGLLGLLHRLGWIVPNSESRFRRPRCTLPKGTYLIHFGMLGVAKAFAIDLLPIETPSILLFSATFLLPSTLTIPLVRLSWVSIEQPIHTRIVRITDPERHRRRSRAVQFRKMLTPRESNRSLRAQ